MIKTVNLNADLSEVVNMRNEFVLDCMELIECLVEKDVIIGAEVVKSIYKGYSKDNMIQAIKYINKEFSRLGLSLDAEYNKALNRLKEILKNIETLKNVYLFNNNEVVADNTVLKVLNKTNFNKKYYTFSYIDNKTYLSIYAISEAGILRLEQDYDDVWNSKENDILITKDNNNNIYKFQFINNKYELIDAYTLKNKGLLKGFQYHNIYGICKVS